jgi:hypothetical protein
MKTQHYDQFTPEERVHLLLAALAREDLDEVGRLDQRCPLVRMVAPHPAYTDLLDRTWDGVVVVLWRWHDVSHRVVQARQAALLLDTIVWLNEVSVRGPGGSTGELKRVISQYRAMMAGADVQYKQCTAIWKAIEAAIARFCTDRDLTTEQLFAMVKRLPTAIDEARSGLDAAVPADPEEEAAVYQILCDAVSPQQARDRGSNPRGAPGEAERNENYETISG